ncbi:MAG TPA: hypothetical protein VFA49_01445 [Chloroflexota bacterium]|nr:hypothetical protein [Chloroflexota bacterium]
MKLSLIIEYRYLRQNITTALLGTFREHHVSIDVLCPQDCHFQPETGVVRTEAGTEYDLLGYDAVISRCRNVLGLAMLGYADTAGIPTINSYRAVQRARNKAEVALALGAAGVPCAPTILADRAAVLRELPRDWFPLILKATYGDASQGLRVIRRPEDLLDLRWSDELALAQHYVVNDGYDLKLYIVGDRVFGMRRPSPLNCDRGATAMPIVPDAEMAAIARRCGQVLGLQIYGVDAIQTDAGPLVIEVNEFPNFTDVPRAADAIADYILDRVMSPPRAVPPVPTEHPRYLPVRAEWRRAELKGGLHANRLSAAGV